MADLTVKSAVKDRLTDQNVAVSSTMPLMMKSTNFSKTLPAALKTTIARPSNPAICSVARS